MKAFSHLGALCAAAILAAFAGMPLMGTAAHAEGILAGISKTAANMIATQAIIAAHVQADPAKSTAASMTADEQELEAFIQALSSQGCVATEQQIATKLRPLNTGKQRANVTVGAHPQIAMADPFDGLTSPSATAAHMPINIGPVAKSEIASPGGIGRLPAEIDII